MKVMVRAKSHPVIGDCLEYTMSFFSRLAILFVLKCLIGSIRSRTTLGQAGNEIELNLTVIG